MKRGVWQCYRHDWQDALPPFSRASCSIFTQSLVLDAPPHYSLRKKGGRGGVRCRRGVLSGKKRRIRKKGGRDDRKSRLQSFGVLGPLWLHGRNPISVKRHSIVKHCNSFVLQSGHDLSEVIYKEPIPPSVHKGKRSGPGRGIVVGRYQRMTQD